VVGAKPGDAVIAGQSLAGVYARRRDVRAAAARLLRGAFVIADEPPEARPVVLGRD